MRPIERESSPSVSSARAFATGKTMFCEKTVVMATVEKDELGLVERGVAGSAPGDLRNGDSPA